MFSKIRQSIRKNENNVISTSTRRIRTRTSTTTMDIQNLSISSSSSTATVLNNNRYIDDDNVDDDLYALYNDEYTDKNDIQQDSVQEGEEDEEILQQQQEQLFTENILGYQFSDYTNVISKTTTTSTDKKTTNNNNNINIENSINDTTNSTLTISDLALLIQQELNLPDSYYSDYLNDTTSNDIATSNGTAVDDTTGSTSTRTSTDITGSNNNSTKSSMELLFTIDLLKSLPWNYIFYQLNTNSTTRSINSIYQSGSNDNNNNIDSSDDNDTDDTNDTDNDNDNIDNNYNNNTNNPWDVYCINKLCIYDDLLNTVQLHLLQYVSQHQQQIAYANQCIHEFDQSLRLAFIYYYRTQLSFNNCTIISSTTNNTNNDTTTTSSSCSTQTDAEEEEWDHTNNNNNSPLDLLQLWDQRDDYIQIQSLVVQLDNIYTKEQQLLYQIDTFDTRKYCTTTTSTTTTTTSSATTNLQQHQQQPFPTAFDEYRSIRTKAIELQNEIYQPDTDTDTDTTTTSSTITTLSSLHCISEMKIRLQSIDDRFWIRLRTLAESIVIRYCRAKKCTPIHNVHNWIEYKSVFDAVLDLQQVHVVSDDNSTLPATGASTLLSSSTNWVSDWTDTIITTLLYEANRTFGIALLETTPTLPTRRTGTGRRSKVVNTTTTTTTTTSFCEEKANKNWYNSTYLPYSQDAYNINDNDDNDDDDDEEIGALFNYECLFAQFSTELDSEWGDIGNLSCTIQELADLQFSTEMRYSNIVQTRHYLCQVFYKTCQSLTSILNTFSLFVDWHRNQIALSSTTDDSNQSKSQQQRLESLLSYLVTNKTRIWDCCETVLVDCINKYMNVARLHTHKVKQEQQQKQQQSNDTEGDWITELKFINQIVQIANFFMSMKIPFLDESSDIDDCMRSSVHEPISDNNNNKDNTNTFNNNIHNPESVHDKEQSILGQKILEFCHTYLRTIHSTAMTSVGNRLYNETWILGNFHFNTDSNNKSNNSNSTGESTTHTTGQISIETILLQALESASQKLQRGNDERYSSTGKTSPTNPTKYDKVEQNQHQQFTEGFLSVLGSNIHFPFVNNPFATLSLSEWDKFFDNTITPFQLSNDTAAETLSEADVDARLEVRLALTELIKDGTVCNTNDIGSIRIAPDAVTLELTLWFARLLIIMDKLPFLYHNIADILANLCDLYYLTVFRLCTGNARSENILLGMDRPICLPLTPYEDKTSQSKYNTNTPGSPLFRPFYGSGKQKPNNRTTINSYRKVTSRSNYVSPQVDAEICAPVYVDKEDLVSLRMYIQHAQQRLSKSVNLDMVNTWLIVSNDKRKTELEIASEASRMLEKRISAVWSCYTVVSLLEITCSVARTCSIRNSQWMKNCFFLCSDNSSAPLQRMRNYTIELLLNTNKFVSVSTQISCIRSISGAEIVEDIIHVEKGWTDQILNEYSNGYVERLCDRASLIWGFLSGSGKLPNPALSSTWDGIITVSYMALIEGFSRIQICSTEGRSLMTLDLASLNAGLSSSAIQERLQGNGSSDYKTDSVDDDEKSTDNDNDNFDNERSCIMVAAKRTHSDSILISRNMMSFVDMYVKVFYYPLDDALQWIHHNFEKYRFDYSVALIVSVINSIPPQQEEEQVQQQQQQQKKQKQARSISDALYNDLIEKISIVYNRKVNS